METADAGTIALNGPDPVINGDCTSGGPPCNFTVGSLSNTDQTADGWTYSWSLSPSAGVIASDTRCARS